MNTIYKYKLSAEGTQNILIRGTGKVLCVQAQQDIPCIWILIDTSEQVVETHRIHIFGTGQPDIQTEGLTYIGTVQLYSGSLVFHVFEE